MTGNFLLVTRLINISACVLACVRARARALVCAIDILVHCTIFLLWSPIAHNCGSLVGLCRKKALKVKWSRTTPTSLLPRIIIF